MHLDESLHNMFSDLAKVRKVQSFLGNIIQNTTNKFELKLDDIMDSIGVKPNRLGRDFDAPHVWGTLSQVISNLVSISNKTETDMKSLREEMLKKVVRLSKETVVENEKKNERRCKQALEETEKVKNAVLILSEKTKEGMDWLGKHISSTQVATSTFNQNYITSLESKIQDIKRTIKRISWERAN